MGSSTEEARVKERFEALQESENQYRQVVENLSAAVYTCDANGYITFYNKAAIELWGREPELYKDRWCGSWKIFWPDGTPVPLDTCPMGIALKEGRAVSGKEIIVERPDGSRRNVLPHPQPIFDAGGKVTGALNMLVDVTAQHELRRAREKAEKATRESEASLHAIFQNSKDGYLLIDAETRILAFNKVGSELYEAINGQKFKVGQRVEEVINQQHREEGMLAIQLALEGHVSERRTKYVSADGKEYWIKVYYNPVTDDDGTIIAVCIGYSDITPEMETQLHLSKLASIVQSSNDAIVSRTLDGIVTSWNPAAERMFGYSAEEMMGKSVSDLMPHDLVQEEWPQIQECLRRGERVERHTKRIAKDGHLLDVLLSISPVKNIDGTIVGISKIVRDLTEKERLAVQLTESEERTRIAIEATEMGIWDLDLFTGKIIISGHYQQIAGVEDMTGWNMEKFEAMVHPDDRENRHEAHRRAQKEGRLFYECRIVRPDKSLRWIRVNGKTIYDKTQKPIRILGTVLDITDHRLKSIALLESESRFRNMADQTPAFVWMVDATNQVTYCNQTFLEYIGVPDVSDFIRNGLWTGFVHPDDLARAAEIYDIALNSRRPYSIESRIREAHTGEYRWFLTKGVPRYLPNQEFAGYVGTAVDIHERMIAEQAVQESVERMHFLADAMPQKVWTASPKGDVTYMNGQWIAYSGITFDEFQQLGWASVIHPEDMDRLNTSWEHSVKTGQDFEMEHRFRRHDGEYRWHLTRSIPQRNEQGKVLMWVATDTDIHDKKQTEEELVFANKIAEHALQKRDKALHELMEAKKQLEELMKVKEQFLSNMSHEIRTPMNAIVGFTNLILKTPLAAEQKQYIDAIKTSGENLLVIINDILDFSRLKASGVTFEKIGFRLSQLMQQLIELLLPKSIEKGVRLSMSIGKNVPDHLVGDPTRLNQILLNLVGNAIKFTEEGEVKAVVSVLVQDDRQVELKFSVMDTGIGIPADKCETIFEPFTQATNDTTRKYGGSGLGLSIVRQYVELQGGSVSVKSTVGLGSTFTFKLTFGKEEAPETDTKTLFPTEELETFRVEGLNVLLVEDNQLNQVLATKLLGEWKWNVELADNGLMAIEKLEQHDFDVVLMDIQLPEMDGYQATRYIRESFDPPKCYVPVIAMTAHAMADEEERCKAAGMDGYISKPFSPKVLYTRITSIIESSGRKKKVGKKKK